MAGHSISIGDTPYPTVDPMGAPGNDYLNVDASPIRRAGQEMERGFGALGQGVEKAADTGIEALTSQAELDQKISASEMSSWAENGFTDNTGKTLSLVGKDAMNAVPGAKERNNQILQQVLNQSVSPQQRLLLENQLRQQMNRNNLLIEEHGARETIKYNIDTSASRIASSGAQAVMFASQGKTDDAANLLVRNVFNEGMNLGHLKDGIDGDALDQFARQHVGAYTLDAVKTIYDQSLGDVGQARKFYEDIDNALKARDPKGQGLDATSRVHIEEFLKKGELSIEAQNYRDGIRKEVGAGGMIDTAIGNAARKSGVTPPTVAPDAVPAATGGPPEAFIFHHTGGRGDVSGVQDTLRQRHLGVEYVMDRDGNITRIGNPGAAHMLPGWGAGSGLSNRNTVGMEVIAEDNRDVTPQQVAAAQKFIREKYPNTPVFGHGEVNPGHKEADEGMAIVGAIRRERGSVARADVQSQAYRGVTDAGADPIKLNQFVAIENPRWDTHGIESGTRATGLTQITPARWDAIRGYLRAGGHGDIADKLTNPADPYQNALAWGYEYNRVHQLASQAVGHDASIGQDYMFWQFGDPARAAAIVRQPDARVSDVVPRDVIRRNPTVYGDGSMTVGQMLDHVGHVMGAAKPAATAAAAPPETAVAYLRDHPELRTDFDKKYGSGAAQRILGP